MGSGGDTDVARRPPFLLPSVRKWGLRRELQLGDAEQVVGCWSDADLDSSPQPASLSALALLLLPLQLLDAFASGAFAVGHRDRRLALRLATSLGDLEVDDEAVPILHQRVAHVSELRLTSASLPPELRFRIRL